MERNRRVSLEIKIVSNLIKRKIGATAAKQYVDRVTGANSWIIGYLSDHEGEDVFQRDLEEQFSIRRSTASSMLQLMEKKGLVKREPVPYDARLKKLMLTEKSYEIREIMDHNIMEIEGQLTKDLSEEELDSFFKTMEKIKKIYHNHNKKEESNI